MAQETNNINPAPAFLKNIYTPEGDELPVRNVKFSALKDIVTFIYTGRILMKNGPDIQDFVDGYKVLEIDLGKSVNKLIKKIVTGNVGEANSESSDSNQVEFKCSNCDKSFQHRKQLLRHVREKHQTREEKEKTVYSCELCGEKYTVC